MIGDREVVEISSDSSEEEEEASDEVEVSESPKAEIAMDAQGDVAMDDAEAPTPDDAEDEERATAEPSFGDLVRANASEPIAVADAFEDSESRPLTYPQDPNQPRSGASLGTVLSQALKTNDVSLLESCLHTTDLNTIRATIQRLDSPLAGTLLQKLAERLHRRPGRAGSLMVWVESDAGHTWWIFGYTARSDSRSLRD